MNKRLGLLLPLLCAVLLLAADEPKIPAMPEALTENAVASLRNGIEIFSLMGIGTKKNWDSVSNKVFVLRLNTGKWSEGRAVPGVAGRLGASAIGAKGQVFVFGGYTVDGQGNLLTVADVNAYLPQAQRWYRAADIPVPVDSAVIGVSHDRYIYLVGGRSKNGPVNNVQVYDVEKNTWSQATAFPGTPVFGHAGGLADETIVYVDGAKKDPSGNYVASDECWMGKIDHKDPNKIDWSKLPAHPGPGRFGIVAGAGEHEHRILFSGGMTGPHNYKGLDNEGKPAEISPVTFAYELHGKRWETISQDTYDVRADTHGIVFTPLGPLIVGGTLKNSAISARVLALPKK
ncbi:MAG TPA: kelch repeat-containing protein [Candidatus Sulfotelmatobacter sp.]|nr:kelch repeat-containing protein [Candidatus Sulfotelmatobacter sp.]